MTKTHYRKVFKSDHLGQADVEEFMEEGRSLVFTISHVNQEYGTRVAGRAIDANIAYFNEKIKPMVLNATNSAVIKKFCNSPFVEDWKNIRVEISIDRNVKMKGQVVGGLRLKISNKKEIMNPNHHRWQEAEQRVAAGMSISEMRKFYDITDEDYAKLCG